VTFDTHQLSFLYKSLPDPRLVFFRRFTTPVSRTLQFFLIAHSSVRLSLPFFPPWRPCRNSRYEWVSTVHVSPFFPPLNGAKPPFSCRPGTAFFSLHLGPSPVLASVFSPGFLCHEGLRENLFIVATPEEVSGLVFPGRLQWNIVFLASTSPSLAVPFHPPPSSR